MESERGHGPPPSSFVAVFAPHSQEALCLLPLGEESGVFCLTNDVMATCSNGPKLSVIVSKTSDAWFPLQYISPKTQRDLSYLKQRVERMNSVGPMFTDFTWGTGESAAEVMIRLSNIAQNEVRFRRCAG